MRSSRLVLPQFFPVDYGAFCYSAFTRVILVFNGQYLCNSLYFIHDIWLSMNTFGPCVWNK
jgi:hypothetical protein